MKNLVQTAAISALVALVVVIGFNGLVGGNQSDLGASGTRFPSGISTTGTLTVGTNGSAISKVIIGSCNPSVYSTLSATSSVIAECAVTGAVSGDNVAISLPAGASAGSVQGGFVLGGAFASSTSGYIDFYYVNLSGQATTSYPLATTTVRYRVTR